MLVACFSFILISSIILSGDANLYREVYVGTYGNSTYLIHRGKYHLFPTEFQEQTGNALGVNISHARQITSTQFHQLKQGSDVPILQVSDYRNLDKIMEVALSSNHFLQGKLLSNYSRVGDYINPDVFYFHGRYLMSTCLTWKFSGLNENKQMEDRLQFRWVNLSYSPYSTSFFLNNETGNEEETFFLGLNDHIRDINGVYIQGQDPRILPFSANAFYVIFANRYFQSNTKSTRMGVAELFFNKEKNVIDVGRVVEEIDYPNPNDHQKNWSPFFWNEKDNSSLRIDSDNVKTSSLDIYFVQTINPLRIVKISMSNATKDPTVKNKIPHELISVAPEALLGYRFGQLRGGTNAIDIGDKYLAFFHSVHRLEGSFLTTYWMGAYTFTKKPPFRLLSVSPEPIMDEFLYTGPWYRNYRNRHLDYIVFPMGLRQLDDNTLLLSFGKQDVSGYTALVDRKRLLQSLQPVLYCDTLSVKTPNYHEKRRACENRF